MIGCDDALGALMAHLKSKGELDNTLIIVTQDHGQMAKDSLYQGGVRTALFARYVGAPRWPLHWGSLANGRFTWGGSWIF